VWDNIGWAFAGEKRVSSKVLSDLHELLRVPKSGGLASVDGDVFFHTFGALPPTMKVDFHLGRKVCLWFLTFNNVCLNVYCVRV
jgi:hypothetical protein